MSISSAPGSREVLDPPSGPWTPAGISRAVMPRRREGVRLPMRFRVGYQIHPQHCTIEQIREEGGRPGQRERHDQAGPQRPSSRPRPGVRELLSAATRWAARRAHKAGLVRPISSAVRAVSPAPPGAAERAPRRGPALGEARGLQQRARLRGQQGAQARVPDDRGDRAGMRHTRLHRRRPVQPHPLGRGRGRARRHEVRADPGELGGLARRAVGPRGQSSSSAGSSAQTSDSCQPRSGSGSRRVGNAPSRRSGRPVASRTRSQPGPRITGSGASASRAGPRGRAAGA